MQALADAEAEGTPERIEIAALIGIGHDAEPVVDIGGTAEDVVDREQAANALEPGMARLSPGCWLGRKNSRKLAVAGA